MSSLAINAEGISTLIGFPQEFTVNQLDHYLNVLLNHLSSRAAILPKIGHSQLKSVNTLTNWSLTPVTDFAGIVALTKYTPEFIRSIALPPFFLKKFTAIVQLEQMKQKKSSFLGSSHNWFSANYRVKCLLISFGF